MSTGSALAKVDRPRSRLWAFLQGALERLTGPTVARGAACAKAAGPPKETGCFLTVRLSR